MHDVHSKSGEAGTEQAADWGAWAEGSRGRSELAAAPDVLRIDLGSAGGFLMDDRTVEACLRLLARSEIAVLDLHGHPAELHPRFEELAILAHALHRRVIHRCSLLTLGAHGLWKLAETLADHDVQVVAALPGEQAGSAEESAIEAAWQGLHWLSAAGYRGEEAGPRLDLVVPVKGRIDSLERHAAEAAWREVLRARGLRFDRLHLTELRDNDPDASFLVRLQERAAAVSPGTLLGLPCAAALSVSPDGTVSSRTRQAHATPA